MPDPLEWRAPTNPALSYPGKAEFRRQRRVDWVSPEPRRMRGVFSGARLRRTVVDLSDFEDEVLRSYGID